jgi:hypothetical protein
MSLTRRSRLKTNGQLWWADAEDEELLELRLKDLGVQVAGTWLERCMDQMHREMAAKGVVARAHAWLSDEWFSPHATPGVAFPFYLAHPRLMRLERKMMLEVEGGTKRECMRILRHEAGHVVQRAFGLHRRSRWRELFGISSKPYPEHYRPNPASRRYVLHLRRWYAQSHPDEDFAETFAVWLTPGSNWRKKYANWPALKKLEYVDELMRELADNKPPSKPRFEIDPLSTLNMTLKQHYDDKRERYAIDMPSVFDRDLKRMFSDDPAHRDAPAATAVLRRHRAKIRHSVARWTGEYPVALDIAMDDMIERCRALKLRAPGSEDRIRLELTALLSTKAVSSLYSASRRQSFAI